MGKEDVIRNSEINEEELKTPKISRGLAITALILNIIIVPGLGSLVGRKIKEGIFQLVLFAIFVVISLDLHTSIITENRYAGWVSLIFYTSFFLSWGWGVFTGIQLIRESSLENIPKNEIKDKILKTDKNYLIPIIISINSVMILFSFLFFGFGGVMGGVDRYINLSILITLLAGFINIYSLIQLYRGKEKAFYFYIISVVLFIIFGFIISSPFELLNDLIDGKLVTMYVYYILIPVNLICLFVLSLKKKVILITIFIILILSLGVLAKPNLKFLNEQKTKEKAQVNQELLELNNFIAQYKVMEIPYLKKGFISLSNEKNQISMEYYCPTDKDPKYGRIRVYQYLINPPNSMDRIIRREREDKLEDVKVNNYPGKLWSLEKNITTTHTKVKTGEKTIEVTKSEDFLLYFQTENLIIRIDKGCNLTKQDLLNLANSMIIQKFNLTIKDIR